MNGIANDSGTVSSTRWLYDRRTVGGKLYEGWMPERLQCSHASSTCS
ncbi:MAG: hypothetical protein ACJ8AO_19390 [Gemmatimonadaceae bacterium]